MKFRTLLVDDELLARQRLTRLLQNYTDIIEIIAEASNGEEAVQLIEEHNPDLVFLDIEMPVYNGLEVLQKITTDPLVVFTTAYENYAIKAFENNSVDYLIKPIEIEFWQGRENRLHDRIQYSYRDNTWTFKRLQP